MIRPAEQTEVPLKAEKIFVSEDESGITGVVGLSRVEGQLWIHDIQFWGTDPTQVLGLLSKARKQAKDWGFTKFWTNIKHGSPLMNFCMDNYKLEQCIFTGEIGGVFVTVTDCPQCGGTDIISNKNDGERFCRDCKHKWLPIDDKKVII